MNFLNPYSRSEYKNFFQDSLLTDSFRFIEEELSLEFKPSFIKKAELIGRDKSLKLEVYEIEHLSENDPRVGLSKDFFRMMASYGSKRALAIFHSPKSKNYRLSLATVDLSLEGSRVKREYSNPRRYSFFLGIDAKIHTPYDFLIKKGRVKDFDDLQNRFSIEVVNKEFYKEIANWYFWALKKVKFPDDAEAEKNGREISVIRLITRLIFIWFMKVRKLLPEELFDEDSIKEILNDVKLSNDNYYKAILQNLFFATLNTKQNDRRFTSKKKGYKGFSQDFGNHNVYRYEELFNDSEDVIEKYFMPIPFLNGGLFECLDYKKTKPSEERKYIDGFTETKSQQPSVPNFLFFNDDKEIDLNKDYGTTNKRYNVRGLINTLSLYNFTIDESDPNDADVALDPELLGKVFENLLASYNPETAKTARKSTGSYYTPRPIVDYMVDESLKQYFKTHIEIDDVDNKLNILFSGEDQSNPFDVVLTKKLVNLIDSLRVVDPAVGSGAFPMRILNRLVFLLHKLDPDNSLWKQSQIDGIKKSVKDITLQRKFIEETERKFKEKNPNYGRKLYLIEKCIYGVDIQQIAVEIAKLRFFISLLVDEKVDNGEIEPLPNLDFKLMQGNSLISSFAGIDFTTKPQNDDNLFDFDEKYKQLIEEFEELKSQYQNEPDVHKKRELRDEIDTKLSGIFEEKLRQHYPQLNDLENKYSGKKEIIEAEKKKLFRKIGIDVEQAEQDLIAYTEGRKQKNFFLWDVYFAEVFAEKSGFDIVIGNPPYVSALELKKLIPSAEYYFLKDNFETAKGAIDFYIYFFEKGIKLLKKSGILSYISPNRYLSASYGIALRKFIFNNAQIHSIIDYSDIKVFETVSTYPLISLLKKEKINNYQILIGKYDSAIGALRFNKVYSNKLTFTEEYIWGFLLNDKIKITEKIFSQSIPLNQVCQINATSTASEADDYHYLINNNKGYKLINTGTIDKYSNSWGKELMVDKGERYLKPFLPINSNKISKNRQQLYSSSKIIFAKIAIQTEAFYDENGEYASINTNCLHSFSKDINPKYILAWVNSKLFQFTFECLFDGLKMQGGYLLYSSPNLSNMYIKKISIGLQKLIANIVDKILEKKTKNPEADTKHLEAKIDIMVYKLYSLTYEEVKIIDPAFALTEREYDNFKIE